MSVFKRSCPDEVEGTSSDLLHHRLSLAADSWVTPRQRLEQSVGRLEVENAVVEIIKTKGKLINQMGFAWKKTKYLHIEEALFLVDQGYLLVFQTFEDKTRLLSLKDVYSLLNQCGISIEVYSIYADLKANGYVVFRHPLRLTLAQDESPDDVWYEWKKSASNSQAEVIYELFEAPSKFKRSADPTPEKYIALVPNQRISLDKIRDLEGTIDAPILCVFYSNGEIVYYSMEVQDESNVE